MAVTTSAIPRTEIGYAQAPNSYWWLYEPETTPELQWPQSIAVYDNMRRTDSQCASVLRAVTLPVRRTPWRIDPNGARDEVVEWVANDLGLPIVGVDPKPVIRTKDRFSWPEHLRLALLMLVFGHSYFEQTYRIDPDGKRAHLAKLAQRPSRTIEQINVAPDGGLVSIKQWWTATNREPKPIPVAALVAYVLDREGGNWLGQSLLRSCYKNALLKDRLLRVQAQTIERNGMGVPLYKGGELESDLTAGFAMAKAWRSGETAGTAVPFGADLILRGVEGTLPDAEPAIRYHDEQIARGVLAHFLNLGTQTGSWALGSTFADFFTLSLQTVAQQIADTATCHVVEDLVDANWGLDEPAPKICFDEIGSRPDAGALATLIQAGAIVSDSTLEAALRQQFALPPAKPQERPSIDAGGTPPPAPLAPAPELTPEGYGTESVAAAAVVEVQEPLSDDDEAAVEDLLDVLAALGHDSRVLAAAGQLRQRKGTNVGGQFTRSLDGRIIDALQKWASGDGSDRPFTRPDVGKPFTAAQLRTVVERTPGLHKPAPRTSAVAMERQLLDHHRDIIGASLPGKGKGDHGPDGPKVRSAPPADKPDGDADIAVSDVDRATKVQDHLGQIIDAPDTDAAHAAAAKLRGEDLDAAMRLVDIRVPGSATRRRGLLVDRLHTLGGHISQHHAGGDGAERGKFRDRMHADIAERVQAVKDGDLDLKAAPRVKAVPKAPKAPTAPREVKPKATLPSERLDHIRDVLREISTATNDEDAARLAADLKGPDLDAAREMAGVARRSSSADRRRADIVESLGGYERFANAINKGHSLPGDSRRSREEVLKERLDLIDAGRAKLDERGADSPGGRPSPETAGRIRQSRIDSARAVADLATQVEELAVNGNSDKAILNRIDTIAKRHPDNPEVQTLATEVRGMVVQQAYDELATAPEAWVPLRVLRERLGSPPKAELDATLLSMAKSRRAFFMHEENQKTLTADDDAAAIVQGGERRHLVSLTPNAGPTDHKALAEHVRTRLQEMGHRPIGRAGERVTFDPKQHEAVGGGTLRAGEPAVVVRPGYVAGIDGEDVTLGKAVVSGGSGASQSPSSILAGLDPNLTNAQKRARLRRRGVSKAEIDALVPLASRKKAVRAAAGHDVTPGHDQLHHYWTRGKGLARWADSPTPWTTLVANLVDEGVPIVKARVFASRWFIEVKGYSAGSDKNRVAHGHPPRGHRVGPG